MINFVSEKILPIFAVFFLILGTILAIEAIIIIYKEDILKQDDYIKNLEEKLNIYEESYDKFCLEDSLRQVQ